MRAGPARVEDAGDSHEPVEVGLAIAADLELEAALAVGRDDFGERLRQAVVDARAGRLVAAVIGSTRPTVWRASMLGAGCRPARKDVKSNAPRSGIVGCATMPGRLLRIAVQKLTPCRRQTASRTPRSTSALPKPATSGGRPSSRPARN